jgi:predicted AAA+ superfamily ATPase
MEYANLHPRLLVPRLQEALADTPVVLITGPRQAGKTTLVRHLAETGMRYLTLDDNLTLLSAREDPVGFIRNLDRAVIDEIQRAPALLLAIKKTVDEDRRPGRFLLTGSANLMALPLVADSLAGRMETLVLYPFAQCEIQQHGTHWLDEVFTGKIPEVAQPLLCDALREAVLCGGYPEAFARATPRRRQAWHRQYLDVLIQRDVQEIANIDKLGQLPQFLRALAEMAGQLCNYSQLGAQMGMDAKTANKYMSIFEQMYLLKRIPVWAGNRLKRVLKSPKLQFIDSGLLASLRGVTEDTLQRDRSLFGGLLETFVYGELLKHATWAETDDYQILYYRDADQYEVDFVVENRAGELIGVEVKASATITEKDLRGLKRLQGLAGNAMRMGIILYDGAEALPLGDRLWAMPLSGLWA